MRRSSTRYLARGGGRRWDTRGVLLDGRRFRGRVRLEEVFGNARPVEVEVGTGKGAFLLARAKARPELNFLGIEVAKAYCCYAADRFRRHSLTNVRMLAADAADIFRRALPAARILRVHIYFPDPWPKRKHHRRRLIKLAFIDDVRRAVRLGGQVLIVTDHLDYFEQIRRVFAFAHGWAAVPMPRFSEGDNGLIGTNFERKYVAQGINFYSLARLRYL